MVYIFFLSHLNDVELRLITGKLAAKEGQIEAVKFLLDRGADVNVMDNDGE